MNRTIIRSIPLLILFLALAPVAISSGNFVAESALTSMFQVNPLNEQAYAQANESLPKILYLITLQVAVLLSLFFYRVSKLAAAS